MDHQRGIAYAERTMFSAQSRGARLALASSHREEAVLKTREYLRRLGRATALESMPCVHIAGTKGKGSTCAFTESILRRSGLKTGLFVSPHLTTVRERFRINGKPVATAVFLRCFWRVWDTLRAWRHREPSETEMMEAAGACVKQGAGSKAGGSSWNPLAAADLVQPAVPGFFHLATLVAFEIFIEEGVDVAVIEVGMGGRLDATNVIPFPAVTGIATLDYDHVDVLGGNIRSIAREKAGIMKRGCPALAVRQPIDGAEEVLASCASRAGTRLAWSEYDALARHHIMARSGASAAASAIQIDRAGVLCDEKISAGEEGKHAMLGLAGRFQATNAALAAHCAEALWRRLGQWDRVSTGKTCDLKLAKACWIREVASLKRGDAADSPAPATSTSAASQAPDLDRVHVHGGYLETLPEASRAGLQTARWDGRCQTLRVRLERLEPQEHAADSGAGGSPSAAVPCRIVGRDVLDGSLPPIGPVLAAESHTGSGRGPQSVVCLDGAHTERSMLECVRWFHEETGDRKAESSHAKRVLLFNASHEKDVVQLLLPLTCLSWDAVAMCPFDMARPSRKPYPSVDGCLKKYVSRLIDAGDTDAAGRIQSEWGLDESSAGAGASPLPSLSPGDKLAWQRTLADLWLRLGTESRFSGARQRAAASVGMEEEVPSEVPAPALYGSVREAMIGCLGSQGEGTEGHIASILCTGSLYLVGNVLGYVERI